MLLACLSALACPAHAQEPDPEPISEPEPDPVSDPEPELSFSATATTRREEPGYTSVAAREVRDLPGLQGDPYRVVETLPSVVPILSGLPYSYVRGAPPASSITLYDDIPIPSLFHLAAGPSVIHPLLLGEVHMWPAAAPARYGRSLGAVILGDAARLPATLGGEVELRLLDVNGLIHAPLDSRTTVVAAGRFGFPGLIARAITPDLTIDWGDWQLRLVHVDDQGGRLTLVVLGAYDNFAQGFADFDALGDAQGIQLQFHRVDLRYQRDVAPDVELGVAMRFGWDESHVGDALHVAVASLSPRIWTAIRLERVRLRLGADLAISRGDIRPTNDPERSIEGILPSDPRFTGARTRSASSAYAEMTVLAPPLLRLELGARADVWVNAREVQAAPSIRARAVVTPLEELEVHASFGLNYQPATLFVPLPGLADAALADGLSRAVQGDLGFTTTLPEHVSVEVQGFVHAYDDLALPDLYLQDREVCFIGVGCIQAELDPHASALVYGAEIFLRRALSEDLAGWISYTLSEASAHSVDGFDFTPAFDVRHVLNAMVRWRILPGLEVSVRAFLRSGRMSGRFYATESITLGRYEQRLPPFFRMDAEASYAWDAGWARLRVALGWFNVTIAEEPFGLDCETDALQRPMAPCTVRSAPPIFYPSLSLRASL